MSATSFAVVVTCYNYCDYVIEAVESALAQARPAAQVVVVDDGSTDGSTALLRERYAGDGRVILLCVENGGQLSAFRHGLAHVDADVVCFLDADDRWDTDHLAKLASVFDARGEVDFVFTDVRLFGEENRSMAFADRPMDLGYTAISTYILGQKYGAPTSALALRTPMARRTLDLPPDEVARWKICADNCLVYGASILGARKLFLPTGSVHYRTHGQNGWWGSNSPEREYRNRFNSRCLVELYARRIGITPLCVDDARHEFRTKSHPSWRECKRYADLVMRGGASWPLRVERALRILKRGWRSRRDAPVENKVVP